MLFRSYTYDANHRLLTIHDPRGIQPIRNDYDADGRLISHTDGFGKQITDIHDIASRVETVTDRLGNPTRFRSEEPKTSSLPTVPGMGVKLMFALVIGALRWQCGVTEAWNLRTLPPGKVTVTTCEPNGSRQ